MIESITIPKGLPENSVLNYDFLRAEGIKHIQQLAGHVWTDHNAHDPGITILEQLCYAITDLGYRIDNDIQDVLGTNDSSSYRDLYGPASILTVNPVTLLDIRKVVIDISGVKNAWVEKVSEAEEEDASLIRMKGLYRVVFEKDEAADVSAQLLGKVKERLQACRGICEDFSEIRLLDPQYVRLHGTVELGHVDDLNHFVAEVLLKAAAHISPKVPFYNLQELLDQGKKIDEIFDGPTLEHGFIDNNELLQTNRKQEIHTSDLIREIMDQKSVLAVNDLSLSTGSGNQKNWVLPLDMAKTPKLDVRGTLNSLVFAKQGLVASIDRDRIHQLYLEKRDAEQFEVLSPAARDIVLPETQDRSLESYYSIQNQFPANYGIGTLGLSDSAPAERKAQAKQLKSYLLFFEQLLANYFSQIAHVKDLMGFDGEDRRTYFNQSLLETIPGMEDVVGSKEGYEGFLEEMNTDSDTGLERKNSFLNHLLARFSEAFTDYGMLLHDPENSIPHSAAQKLITDKSNFLKDYPALSSGRARAFNYTEAFWGTDNISGLEKRIARKLGIEDYTRRALGDGEEEGFHLLEHILLRPKASDPSREILAVEAAERMGFTKFTSLNHQLLIGDEVRIEGSESYDGEHTIDQVSENSFEIELPFVAPVNTSPESLPKWERTQIDVRDLVFSDPVTAFVASSRSSHTVCEVEQHGLLAGESIEIMGTEHYNGVYTVSEVSTDTFEIEQEFAGNETAGRWAPPTLEGDPYSLQLTFVFPNWTARYQNENFKQFVENIIREETPAHLTTYVQWLNKVDMQRFDQAYHQFLSTLTK